MGHAGAVGPTDMADADSVALTYPARWVDYGGSVVWCKL